MRLKIITHEKVVFDEDVEEVYTRGNDGEFGILKNHVPVMSALAIGVTKAIQNGTPILFTTMGGVLQFKDDECIILTPTAERGDQIDVMRAQEALKRAKNRLEDRNAELDVKRAEIAVAKAMARLKATLNN